MNINQAAFVLSLRFSFTLRRATRFLQAKMNFFKTEIKLRIRIRRINDAHPDYQCCGSESGSTGSTCFWAFWIRIHLSEVWIRIRIRILLWIRILLSSCKNSKKNLDSYLFVTLFDFSSLKNYVNVASKRNKEKKLC
jgi:hypothetical protein